MTWLAAILAIVEKGVAWAFAGWKKKHDPTVPQRTDQIAKNYATKRQDLDRR